MADERQSGGRTEQRGPGGVATIPGSSGGTAGESVGSRFAFRKRLRSALVATDDAETPGNGDRTARLRSDNEGIIQ